MGIMPTEPNPVGVKLEDPGVKMEPAHLPTTEQPPAKPSFAKVFRRGSTAIFILIVSGCRICVSAEQWEEGLECRLTGSQNPNHDVFDHEHTVRLAKC